MTEICPLCNCPTEPIEVHGHIQCQICHGNYSPCCNGETNDSCTKLRYVQVILEDCSDTELEQVLIDVAVHFLKELQEIKHD
jgi:hypothetical protein